MITLAADIFFVDRTAFLLTVARRIKFVTAEHVPVRTATSLRKHLKRVLEVYGCAGFVVRIILMDGEFEKIKSLMPSIECNTTAAKERVSKAEQTIRTVKERIRGLLATLPFSHVPKRMYIEFVYFVILWLNAFPVKSEISQTISPRELLSVGVWTTRIIVECSQAPTVKCTMNQYLRTPWRGAPTRP